MGKRKGIDRTGLTIIVVVVVGLILTMVMSGVLFSGIETSGKGANETIESSSLNCQRICFECCNGMMEGLDKDECEKPPHSPAPGSTHTELAKCNCKC